MNLGPSPTFDDANVRIEVHLIGRSEPLYGQPLEVDFLARLRDIRPFPSAESLTKQITDDVDSKRLTTRTSQD